MELIPAIDLKDGGCVRLFQGRFDAVTEKHKKKPRKLLRRYRSLLDEITEVCKRRH